ncbi:MAG: uridylate kinase [Hyphomicrobium sp.]|nr:uridylate kinase [Hyphomicrobium sp.]
MAVAETRAPLPLVVKVGGSLAESGRLASALTDIADARRRVVVVAGGGAFADKVRDLQHALNFNDATAHRLAMLGMHQMAEVFVSNARFSMAESIDAIADVLQAGAIPVWVPLPTLERDASIPADWSITSDGIAARLAELLGGAPLALLKSCDVPPGRDAVALAAEGIVDAAFPGIVARANLDWRVFGPHDNSAFKALLATPS